MNMITLISIIMTIGVYVVVLRLAKKYKSPLMSPVILTTTILIISFFLFNISYDDYGAARDIITYLLGPATVALALPIYRNRHLLKQYIISALVGLIVGTISTIISALVIATIFKLPSDFQKALALKSITVPVASEVAKIISANELLVVTYVIITGLLGALLGPVVMNFFKIKHPFARGLSMGTIAHGIGTAEILKEGEVQGAISAVAMGLSAIVTAIVLPFVL